MNIFNTPLIYDLAMTFVGLDLLVIGVVAFGLVVYWYANKEEKSIDKKSE